MNFRKNHRIEWEREAAANSIHHLLNVQNNYILFKSSKKRRKEKRKKTFKV